MEIKSLPAQLRFTVYKQPCKNIHIISSNNDVVVKWEAGDLQEIKTKDLEEFKNDTMGLFTFLFTALHIGKAIPIDLVENYFSTWGPIQQSPSKKNEINLKEMIDLCYAGFSCLSLINMWRNPELIERFFREIESYNKSTNGFLPQAKYWYLDMDKNKKGEYEITFLPRSEKLEKKYSFIRPYIKQPSEKDYIKFENEPNNKLKFVREAILQNIADYITRQNLTFRAKVEMDQLYLCGSTSNRVLAYIMLNIYGITNKELAFCECGCGKIVPEGRKYYASDKCIEKKRNHAPLKKIKSWLRTKKSRGTITDTQYFDLCKKADKLYNSDYTEDQIREHIRKELE